MIAYSVNVGAHLVGNVTAALDDRRVVSGRRPAVGESRSGVPQLLIWGWSMSVIGAIICQLLFGYR